MPIVVSNPKGGTVEIPDSILEGGDKVRIGKFLKMKGLPDYDIQMEDVNPQMAQEVYADLEGKRDEALRQISDDATSRQGDIQAQTQMGLDYGPQVPLPGIGGNPLMAIKALMESVTPTQPPIVPGGRFVPNPYAGQMLRPYEELLRTENRSPAEEARVRQIEALRQAPTTSLMDIASAITPDFSEGAAQLLRSAAMYGANRAAGLAPAMVPFYAALGGDGRGAWTAASDLPQYMNRVAESIPALGPQSFDEVWADPGALNKALNLGQFVTRGYVEQAPQLMEMIATRGRRLPMFLGEAGDIYGKAIQEGREGVWPYLMASAGGAVNVWLERLGLWGPIERRFGPEAIKTLDTPRFRTAFWKALKDMAKEPWTEAGQEGVGYAAERAGGAGEQPWSQIRNRVLTAALLALGVSGVMVGPLALKEHGTNVEAARADAAAKVAEEILSRERAAAEAAAAAGATPEAPAGTAAVGATPPPLTTPMSEGQWQLRAAEARRAAAEAAAAQPEYGPWPKREQMVREMMREQGMTRMEAELAVTEWEDARKPGAATTPTVPGTPVTPVPVAPEPQTPGGNYTPQEYQSLTQSFQQARAAIDAARNRGDRAALERLVRDFQDRFGSDIRWDDGLREILRKNQVGGRRWNVQQGRFVTLEAAPAEAATAKETAKGKKMVRVTTPAATATVVSTPEEADADFRTRWESAQEALAQAEQGGNPDDIFNASGQLRWMTGDAWRPGETVDEALARNQSGGKTWDVSQGRFVVTPAGTKAGVKITKPVAPTKGAPANLKATIDQAIEEGRLVPVGGSIWDNAARDRPVVFVRVGNGIQMFYRSTGTGTPGLKKQGEWHPFFGLGVHGHTVGWLIKGTGEQIASGYGRSDLKEAQKWLNKNLNWDSSLDTDLNKGWQKHPLSQWGPKSENGIHQVVQMGAKQLIDTDNVNGADYGSAQAHIQRMLDRLGPEQTHPEAPSAPAPEGRAVVAEGPKGAAAVVTAPAEEEAESALTPPEEEVEAPKTPAPAPAEVSREGFDDFANRLVVALKEYRSTARTKTMGETMTKGKELRDRFGVTNENMNKGPDAIWLANVQAGRRWDTKAGRFVTGQPSNKEVVITKKATPVKKKTEGPVKPQAPSRAKPPKAKFGEKAFEDAIDQQIEELDRKAAQEPGFQAGIPIPADVIQRIALYAQKYASILSRHSMTAAEYVADLIKTRGKDALDLAGPIYRKIFDGSQGQIPIRFTVDELIAALKARGVSDLDAVTLSNKYRSLTVADIGKAPVPAATEKELAKFRETRPVPKEGAFERLADAYVAAMTKANMNPKTIEATRKDILNLNQKVTPIDQRPMTMMWWDRYIRGLPIKYTDVRLTIDRQKGVYEHITPPGYRLDKAAQQYVADPDAHPDLFVSKTVQMNIPAGANIALHTGWKSLFGPRHTASATVLPKKSKKDAQAVYENLVEQLKTKQAIAEGLQKDRKSLQERWAQLIGRANYAKIIPQRWNGATISLDVMSLNPDQSAKFAARGSPMTGAEVYLNRMAKKADRIKERDYETGIMDETIPEFQPPKLMNVEVVGVRGPGERTVIGTEITGAERVRDRGYIAVKLPEGARTAEKALLRKAVQTERIKVDEKDPSIYLIPTNFGGLVHKPTFDAMIKEGRALSEEIDTRRAMVRAGRAAERSSSAPSVDRIVVDRIDEEFEAGLSAAKTTEEAVNELENLEKQISGWVDITKAGRIPETFKDAPSVVAVRTDLNEALSSIRKRIGFLRARMFRADEMYGRWWEAKKDEMGMDNEELEQFASETYEQNQQDKDVQRDHDRLGASRIPSLADQDKWLVSWQNKGTRNTLTYTESLWAQHREITKKYEATDKAIVDADREVMKAEKEWLQSRESSDVEIVPLRKKIADAEAQLVQANEALNAARRSGDEGLEQFHQRVRAITDDLQRASVEMAKKTGTEVQRQKVEDAVAKRDALIRNRSAGRPEGSKKAIADYEASIAAAQAAQDAVNEASGRLSALTEIRDKAQIGTKASESSKGLTEEVRLARERVESSKKDVRDRLAEALRKERARLKESGVKDPQEIAQSLHATRAGITVNTVAATRRLQRELDILENRLLRAQENEKLGKRVGGGEKLEEAITKAEKRLDDLIKKAEAAAEASGQNQYENDIARLGNIEDAIGVNRGNAAPKYDPDRAWRRMVSDLPFSAQLFVRLNGEHIVDAYREGGDLRFKEIKKIRKNIRALQRKRMRAVDRGNTDTELAVSKLITKDEARIKEIENAVEAEAAGEDVEKRLTGVRVHQRGLSAMRNMIGSEMEYFMSTLDLPANEKKLRPGQTETRRMEMLGDFIRAALFSSNRLRLNQKRGGSASRDHVQSLIESKLKGKRFAELNLSGLRMVGFNQLMQGALDNFRKNANANTMELSEEEEENPTAATAPETPEGATPETPPTEEPEPTEEELAGEVAPPEGAVLTEAQKVAEGRRQVGRYIPVTDPRGWPAWIPPGEITPTKGGLFLKNEADLQTIANFVATGWAPSDNEGTTRKVSRRILFLQPTPSVGLAPQNWVYPVLATFTWGKKGQPPRVSVSLPFKAQVNRLVKHGASPKERGKREYEAGTMLSLQDLTTAPGFENARVVGMIRVAPVDAMSTPPINRLSIYRAMSLLDHWNTKVRDIVEGYKQGVPVSEAPEKEDRSDILDEERPNELLSPTGDFVLAQGARVAAPEELDIVHSAVDLIVQLASYINDFGGDTRAAVSAMVTDPSRDIRSLFGRLHDKLVRADVLAESGGKRPQPLKEGDPEGDEGGVNDVWATDFGKKLLEATEEYEKDRTRPTRTELEAREKPGAQERVPGELRPSVARFSRDRTAGLTKAIVEALGLDRNKLFRQELVQGVRTPPVKAGVKIQPVAEQGEAAFNRVMAETIEEAIRNNALNKKSVRRGKVTDTLRDTQQGIATAFEKEAGINWRPGPNRTRTVVLTPEQGFLFYTYFGNSDRENPTIPMWWDVRFMPGGQARITDHGFATDTRVVPTLFIPAAWSDRVKQIEHDRAIIIGREPRVGEEPRERQQEQLAEGRRSMRQLEEAYHANLRRSGIEPGRQKVRKGKLIQKKGEHEGLMPRTNVLGTPEYGTTPTPEGPPPTTVRTRGAQEEAPLVQPPPLEGLDVPTPEGVQRAAELEAGARRPWELTPQAPTTATSMGEQAAERERVAAEQAASTEAQQQTTEQWLADFRSGKIRTAELLLNLPEEGREGMSAYELDIHLQDIFGGQVPEWVRIVDAPDMDFDGALHLRTGNVYLNAARLDTRAQVMDALRHEMLHRVWKDDQVQNEVKDLIAGAEEATFAPLHEVYDVRTPAQRQEERVIKWAEQKLAKVNESRIRRIMAKVQDALYRIPGFAKLARLVGLPMAGAAARRLLARAMAADIRSRASEATPLTPGEQPTSPGQALHLTRGWRAIPNEEEAKRYLAENPDASSVNHQRVLRDIQMQSHLVPKPFSARIEKMGAVTQTQIDRATTEAEVVDLHAQRRAARGLQQILDLHQMVRADKRGVGNPKLAEYAAKVNKMPERNDAEIREKALAKESLRVAAEGVIAWNRWIRGQLSQRIGALKTATEHVKELEEGFTDDVRNHPREIATTLAEMKHDLHEWLDLQPGAMDAESQMVSDTLTRILSVMSGNKTAWDTGDILIRRLMLDPDVVTIVTTPGLSRNDKMDRLMDPAGPVQKVIAADTVLSGDPFIQQLMRPIGTTGKTPLHYFRGLPHYLRTLAHLNLDRLAKDDLVADLQSHWPELNQPGPPGFNVKGLVDRLIHTARTGALASRDYRLTFNQLRRAEITQKSLAHQINFLDELVKDPQYNGQVDAAAQGGEFRYPDLIMEDRSGTESQRDPLIKDGEREREQFNITKKFYVRMPWDGTTREFERDYSVKGDVLFREKIWQTINEIDTWLSKAPPGTDPVLINSYRNFVVPDLMQRMDRNWEIDKSQTGGNLLWYLYVVPKMNSELAAAITSSLEVMISTVGGQNGRLLRGVVDRWNRVTAQSRQALNERDNILGKPLADLEKARGWKTMQYPKIAEWADTILNAIVFHAQTDRQKGLRSGQMLFIPETGRYEKILPEDIAMAEAYKRWSDLIRTTAEGRNAAASESYLDVGVEVPESETEKGDQGRMTRLSISPGKYTMAATASDPGVRLAEKWVDNTPRLATKAATIGPRDRDGTVEANFKKYFATDPVTGRPMDPEMFSHVLLAHLKTDSPLYGQRENSDQRVVYQKMAEDMDGGWAPKNVDEVLERLARYRGSLLPPPKGKAGPDGIVVTPTVDHMAVGRELLAKELQEAMFNFYHRFGPDPGENRTLIRSGDDQFNTARGEMAAPYPFYRYAPATDKQQKALASEVVKNALAPLSRNLEAVLRGIQKDIDQHERDLMAGKPPTFTSKAKWSNKVMFTIQELRAYHAALAKQKNLVDGMMVPHAGRMEGMWGNLQRLFHGLTSAGAAFYLSPVTNFATVTRDLASTSAAQGPAMLWASGEGWLDTLTASVKGLANVTKGLSLMLASSRVGKVLGPVIPFASSMAAAHIKAKAHLNMLDLVDHRLLPDELAAKTLNHLSDEEFRAFMDSTPLGAYFKAKGIRLRRVMTDMIQNAFRYRGMFEDLNSMEMIRAVNRLVDKVKRNFRREMLRRQRRGVYSSDLEDPKSHISPRDIYGVRPWVFQTSTDALRNLRDLFASTNGLEAELYEWFERTKGMSEAQAMAAKLNDRAQNAVESRLVIRVTRPGASSQPMGRNLPGFAGEVASVMSYLKGQQSASHTTAGQLLGRSDRPNAFVRNVAMLGGLMSIGLAVIFGLLAQAEVPDEIRAAISGAGRTHVGIADVMRDPDLAGKYAKALVNYSGILPDTMAHFLGLDQFSYDPTSLSDQLIGVSVIEDTMKAFKMGFQQGPFSGMEFLARRRIPLLNQLWQRLGGEGDASALYRAYSRLAPEGLDKSGAVFGGGFAQVQSPQASLARQSANALIGGDRGKAAVKRRALIRLIRTTGAADSEEAATRADQRIRAQLPTRRAFGRTPTDTEITVIRRRLGPRERALARRERGFISLVAD